VGIPTVAVAATRDCLRNSPHSVFIDVMMLL
jgi:hypothetical protein